MDLQVDSGGPCNKEASFAPGKIDWSASVSPVLFARQDTVPKPTWNPTLGAMKTVVVLE